MQISKSFFEALFHFCEKPRVPLKPAAFNYQDTEISYCQLFYFINSTHLNFCYSWALLRNKGLSLWKFGKLKKGRFIKMINVQYMKLSSFLNFWQIHGKIQRKSLKAYFESSINNTRS